jgi:hypothetical protein
MRLEYRSLTRPKNIAKRIGVVFPALSHMQAQNWAAKLIGYRDWHELSQHVRSYEGEETPDYVLDLDTMLKGGKQPQEATDFFKRGFKQRDILTALLGGVEPPDMASLFFCVDPNNSGFRFNKLGETGKGSAGFVGLGYDLFEHPGEGSDGQGSGIHEEIGFPEPGEDVSRAHVRLGVPQGADAEQFIKAMLKRLQRLSEAPFPGYAGVARDVLLGESFGVTTLEVEDAGDDIPIDSEEEPKLATQSRWLRYFVMADDEPQGFVVVHMEIQADSDSDDVRIEIEIVEGWSGLHDMAEEVEDALISSISGDIAPLVCRVLWFRGGGKQFDVTVDIRSESESRLTWVLAESIGESTRDLVAERCPGRQWMQGLYFTSSVSP